MGASRSELFREVTGIKRFAELRSVQYLWIGLASIYVILYDRVDRGLVIFRKARTFFYQHFIKSNEKAIKFDVAVERWRFGVSQ